MKVFKFGGGILDSAAAVRRIPGIIAMYPGESLIIVVSAFGKTTNALEELIQSRFYGQGDSETILGGVLKYQKEILNGLAGDQSREYTEPSERIFSQLRESLAEELPDDYSEFYDRIIGYGEMISSMLVHLFLLDSRLENQWFDVRNVIRTDSSFREASVNWDESREKAVRVIGHLPDGPGRKILVTQGFIGADSEGRTTSLGREGSDYTASVFAGLLEASEVIIWKDVPGVLNADPRHFRQTVKLDELSYTEATELAFYGAKVIHPKTVKPLQNGNIPLQVRSFLDPGNPGTLIHSKAPAEQYIPSFIIKTGQTLVTISRRDLAFVDEEMFSRVFGILSKFSIHMNLVQNSALTLSFCIDSHPGLEKMVQEMKEHYIIRYNSGLEMLTIRHYTPRAADQFLQGREVLMEQQNRTVVQYVFR
jgi:aspartate kinase